MKHAVVLLLSLACARAPAHVDEPAPPPVSTDGSIVRIPLQSLGLRDAQQFNTQPTLSFPFFARSDRVLTSAGLLLVFGDARGIHSLDVLVNQEKVAQLSAEALHGQTRIAIDAAAIGDKNLLTLLLHPEREGACGKIAPESWKVIRDGELTMQSAPLPLPDELSLLPLPFVDRQFDREASVAFVLPKDPGPRALQAAARVAGWFGVDTGVPLRVNPKLGVLPETSAVVLIDDAHEAALLGLPAPEGPRLLMMDHPHFKSANVKLLVIEGRDANELEIAAATLAAGSSGRFHGPQFAPQGMPAQPAFAEDEAPRWMHAGAPLRLGDLPGGDKLIHDGLSGGKIAATFRLPPDLWVWPDEFVDLDLRWELALPPDAPQPRLDVLVNGDYLGRLPLLDLASGDTHGLSRLRVHRTKLKGFNELVMYVDYADAERICAAPAGGIARVQLLPDTTLHVEKYGLFTPQPDVEALVNDGYPFTRHADLSGMAVVLSSPLEPAELGMALSAVAHFDSITGVAGAPRFVQPDDALAPGFDADLLVLGGPTNNTLARRWADRMPLAGRDLQVPAQGDPLLALFNGRRGMQELGRARGVLAPLQRFLSLVEFESPSRPERSVVAIAASDVSEMRSFSQLRGFAAGSFPRGDLLIAAGDQRHRFSIGPQFGRGQLPRWDALRWFLAQHPLLLVPCLLIGVLGLALLLRTSVGHRMEQRLREDAT